MSEFELMNAAARAYLFALVYPSRSTQEAMNETFAPVVDLPQDDRTLELVRRSSWRYPHLDRGVLSFTSTDRTASLSFGFDERRRIRQIRLRDLTHHTPCRRPRRPFLPHASSASSPVETAASVDTTSKERTMPDLHASPTVLTEMIDGPVELNERIYAFDELRKLCNSSTEPVIRANARLCSEPAKYPNPVAVADCLVVIDDGTVVVAGAVATTMRQAIDELIMRLRRRLSDHTHREHGLEARTTGTGP
jgi:ribosome-associated translation inhibitor RaiA